MSLLLQFQKRDVIIMLYFEVNPNGNRTKNQSSQAEITYEPDGVRAAFRRVLRNGQSLGERESGAFYDDVAFPRGWVMGRIYAFSRICAVCFREGR